MPLPIFLQLSENMNSKNKRLTGWLAV